MSLFLGQFIHLIEVQRKGRLHWWNMLLFFALAGYDCSTPRELVLRISSLFLTKQKATKKKHKILDWSFVCCFFGRCYRGVCVDHLCVCEKGWSGDDCTIGDFLHVLMILELLSLRNQINKNKANPTTGLALLLLWRVLLVWWSLLCSGNITNQTNSLSRRVFGLLPWTKKNSCILHFFPLTSFSFLSL